MRMSREATARSRERILGAAAEMVRERGLEAASIVDVMQAAGMTNGGFYRHFGSKDEMIAAAIGTAFDEIADRFDQRLRRDGAEAAAEAYVEEYLSAYHVEHPGRGCPVAAVGADVGRCSGAFAEDFIEGCEKLIRRLSNTPDSDGGAVPERTEAIRRLAMLVGAVVIARAVGRGALRDEVIGACRQP